MEATSAVHHRPVSQAQWFLFVFLATLVDRGALGLVLTTPVNSRPICVAHAVTPSGLRWGTALLAATLRVANDTVPAGVRLRHLAYGPSAVPLSVPRQVELANGGGAQHVVIAEVSDEGYYRWCLNVVEDSGGTDSVTLMVDLELELFEYTSEGRAFETITSETISRVETLLHMSSEELDASVDRNERLELASAYTAVIVRCTVAVSAAAVVVAAGAQIWYIVKILRDKKLA